MAQELGSPLIWAPLCACPSVILSAESPSFQFVTVLGSLQWGFPVPVWHFWEWSHSRSSWRKVPLNILLFSRFFFPPYCVVPWKLISPGCLSSHLLLPFLSAPPQGLQPGSLLSKVTKQQGWYSHRSAAQPSWARIQTTNSLGHCLERIWRRCCLQQPPHQGMLTGSLHPAASLSSHTYSPRNHLWILSAIILMIVHVDIDIFAAETRALCPQFGYLWLFSLTMSMVGGGWWLLFSHRLSHSSWHISGFPPALPLLVPLPGSSAGDDRSVERN